MSESVIDVKPPERSMRDLYYVIFRHKWKVILFSIGVVAVVTVTTFRAREVFESDAKLLLRLGRESVLLDPTVTGKTTSVYQSRESQINSDLEILKSEDLALKVVEKLGVDRFFQDSGAPSQEAGSPGAEPLPLEGTEISSQKTAEKEKTGGGLMVRLGLRKPLTRRQTAILRVKNNLDFEVLKNTNIIHITYKSGDPLLAQEVIKELIGFYMDAHITVHQSSGSFGFLERQTDGISADITKIEVELRDMRNKSGITTVEEQGKVLMARVGQLHQDLAKNNATMAGTQALIEAIKPVLSRIPETKITGETTGLNNQAFTYMRQELYRLQLQEEEFRSRYTPESDKMTRVREQIEAARKILDQESRFTKQETRGLNEEHLSLKLMLLTETANLESHRAQRESILAQLTTARQEIEELNDLNVKITDRKRELDVLIASYLRYSENREQARINKAVEAESLTNISVVQPATLPIKPIRPRKMLNLALGLLLAVFGSLGVAFFSEYIDHSFRRPEDVEQRLQLPALVAIPWFGGKTGKLFPARGGTNGTHDGKTTGDGTGWDMQEDIVAYAETLQSRVLVEDDGHGSPCRILAVTSCHRGEGTSTIAANLAVMLARPGDRRVLFLDATGRHLLNGKVFGIPAPESLPDIHLHAQNGKISLKPLQAEKLDVLFSLPEFYGSKRLPAILEAIRSEYDYVIIDAPPVLDSNSSLTWASLPDNVIMVVEADRVRWEVAQRAKGLLEQAQAGVLGVVLNKRRFPIPTWLYGAV